MPRFSIQILLCDPKNGDVVAELCNVDGNGEETGGGSFFLLLHEPRSLREGRSLTLDDLLPFVFGGLLSDGEGTTAGTGDSNDGALKAESFKLNAVAACGKEALYDTMGLGSVAVTKPAEDSIGAVIT